MELELNNPVQNSVTRAFKHGKHPFPGYKTITLDFEYFGDDGELVNPVCLVWCDWETGAFHKVWRDELLQMTEPPFDTSEKTLCFSYYWPAEGSCLEVLNWEQPINIIDCFAEFRCLTNGRKVPCGNSLLGAMIWYDCPTMASEMKETMRDLVLTGGPWNDAEKEAILKYCRSDVSALNDLVRKMAPDIELDGALYRGDYLEAVSAMENRGIPIDLANFAAIKKAWPILLEKLIEDVNEDYQIYDGSVFKMDKFGEYLGRKRMQWPRTQTGRYDLSDATFRSKVEQYPELENLRELRSTLSQTRNLQLTVGPDRRNRCMLSPFRSKTGRNQPSNQKFVYGPAKWVRHLIKPERGMALAYVDYEQQEFAIGARLSGDKAMQEAYLSGDPYLSFGKQAKSIPQNATKDSHPKERAQFKTCALGVLFGLTGEGMARKLGMSPEGGRQLLRLHKNCFPDFWRWNRDVVSNALVRMEMKTVLGWRMYVHPRFDLKDRNKERTLANFHHCR